MYYQVDNSSGRFAEVRGFQAMSSATTGTGPFPEVGNSVFFRASHSSSPAQPVRWTLVADGGFVHLLLDASPGYLGRPALYQFGRAVQCRPGDNFASILCGYNSDTVPEWPVPPAGIINMTYANSVGSSWLAGDPAGSLPKQLRRVGTRASVSFSGDLTEIENVYSGPVLFLDEGYRGASPGQFQGLSTRASAMDDPINGRQVISATANTPALLLLACAGETWNASPRYLSLDIEGPWR
jgi:hypothetical protein